MEKFENCRTRTNRSTTFFSDFLKKVFFFLNLCLFCNVCDKRGFSSRMVEKNVKYKGINQIPRNFWLFGNEKNRIILFLLKIAFYLKLERFIRFQLFLINVYIFPFRQSTQKKKCRCHISCIGLFFNIFQCAQMRTIFSNFNTNQTINKSYFQNYTSLFVKSVWLK